MKNLYQRPVTTNHSSLISRPCTRCKTGLNVLQYMHDHKRLDPLKAIGIIAGLKLTCSRCSGVLGKQLQIMASAAMQSLVSVF